MIFGLSSLVMKVSQKQISWSSPEEAKVIRAIKVNVAMIFQILNRLLNPQRMEERTLSALLVLTDGVKSLKFSMDRKVQRVIREHLLLS